MKQRYERILFHAKQLLPCLACIFLLLLIIKQLALDAWLAAIYRAFLPCLLYTSEDLITRNVWTVIQF